MSSAKNADTSKTNSVLCENTASSKPITSPANSTHQISDRNIQNRNSKSPSMPVTTNITPSSARSTEPKPNSNKSDSRGETNGFISIIDSLKIEKTQINENITRPFLDSNLVLTNVGNIPNKPNNILSSPDSRTNLILKKTNSNRPVKTSEKPSEANRVKIKRAASNGEDYFSDSFLDVKSKMDAFMRRRKMLKKNLKSQKQIPVRLSPDKNNNMSTNSLEQVPMEMAVQETEERHKMSKEKNERGKQNLRKTAQENSFRASKPPKPTKPSVNVEKAASRPSACSSKSLERNPNYLSSENECTSNSEDFESHRMTNKKSNKGNTIFSFVILLLENVMCSAAGHCESQMKKRVLFYVLTLL